jgi:hypothetical protein
MHLINEFNRLDVRINHLQRSQTHREYTNGGTEKEKNKNKK